MPEQLSFDEFAEFASFRTEKPSIDAESWSETDTRSKLIDRLLIRCLGWPESSIRRELSRDGERLDYLLSIDRPILIVEAKKHAVAFAIPPKKTQYCVRISSLLNANPSLAPDIEQVQSYCSTWSVPYAALTNGRQLIVFASFRLDGKPWREGEAYVFYDLHSGYDYAALAAVLSKHAFQSNEIYSAFYDIPPVDSAASTISAYNRPNATVARNELGLAVEPFLQAAFTDAVSEDSDEILDKCYVYAADCKLREDELEALLLDRPPVFDEEVTDVDSRNSFLTFGAKLQTYLKALPVS